MFEVTGLGAADQVELLAAALVVGLLLLWNPWLKRAAGWLETRPRWALALFAVLPIVLRLLLLPHHPVPRPRIYDEYSHLLEADTLRHMRLANPPHALPQFFETFFVLQQPTYSSIYPPGQGFLLAIGWTLFGLPWAGVLIAVAAFCAACYWMLRAWTTPRWALAGGLLAVIEFGPLNQWTNQYWGGALAATAGCLVFGALPRLAAAPKQRDAVLLGLGLAIHLITRPYESIFLFLSAVIFLLPALRRQRLWRFAPEIILILIPAAALLAFQNKAVTGSWTTLPEALSQYQYGVPAAFTFQPHPEPHRDLSPEQALDYKMQRGFRGERPETMRSFFERLEFRVRYYRFFFLAPLYLALAAFLPLLRHWRFAWVALTLALFALGVNFFPAFQLHYVAAVTCLFVLASVAGLEELSRWPLAAGLVLLLCVAEFTVWYGVHAFAEDSPLLQFETWDFINHDALDRHTFVARQLNQLPGKLLVFVRYGPRHAFQDEWVYNSADIDASRIVWARDLGEEADRDLQQYYPDRQAWILDPDELPPRLTLAPAD